jgi:hypothetical protein
MAKPRIVYTPTSASYTINFPEIATRFLPTQEHAIEHHLSSSGFSRMANEGGIIRMSCEVDEIVYAKSAHAEFYRKLQTWLCHASRGDPFAYANDTDYMGAETIILAVAADTDTVKCADVTDFSAGDEVMVAQPSSAKIHVTTISVVNASPTNTIELDHDVPWALTINDAYIRHTSFFPQLELADDIIAPEDVIQGGDGNIYSLRFAAREIADWWIPQE